MAMFVIKTSTVEDKKVVDITVDDDATFEDWMMACEFLLCRTVKQSPAGYERAMELLCKGSMDYKTVSINNSS